MRREPCDRRRRAPAPLGDRKTRRGQQQCRARNAHQVELGAARRPPRFRHPRQYDEVERDGRHRGAERGGSTGDYRGRDDACQEAKIEGLRRDHQEIAFARIHLASYFFYVETIEWRN